MASWRFLGSASRSVNRWWKAAGFQSISWLSWILASCILPFCLLALLPVRFDKPTPNRQAEIVQEEHLWSASLGARPGSDLIRTLGFLGAEAAQQDPIKAQFMQSARRISWDRWDRLRPASTCGLFHARQVVKEATDCRVLLHDTWQRVNQRFLLQKQNDALAPGETRCSQTYGWIWRLLFYSTFILGRSSSRVGA